jgi:hypothetical protein
MTNVGSSCRAALLLSPRPARSLSFHKPNMSCPHQHSVVSAQLAVRACPFLADVAVREGREFALAFAHQPLQPVELAAGGPLAEGADVEASFRLFHGVRGPFPLSQAQEAPAAPRARPALPLASLSLACQVRGCDVHRQPAAWCCPGLAPATARLPALRPGQGRALGGGAPQPGLRHSRKPRPRPPCPPRSPTSVPCVGGQPSPAAPGGRRPRGRSRWDTLRRRRHRRRARSHSRATPGAAPRPAAACPPARQRRLGQCQQSAA